jgi:hypothetical protein
MLVTLDATLAFCGKLQEKRALVNGCPGFCTREKKMLLNA